MPFVMIRMKPTSMLGDELEDDEEDVDGQEAEDVRLKFGTG